MWEDRVKRGAELLDERFPKWFHGISVDSLQMGDCAKCILGQLYGRFHDGLNLVGLQFSDGDPELFGFDFPYNWGTEQEMNRLWINEIQIRREKISV